jgi:hypothetical protein
MVGVFILAGPLQDGIWLLWECIFQEQDPRHPDHASQVCRVIIWAAEYLSLGVHTTNGAVMDQGVLKQIAHLGIAVVPQDMDAELEDQFLQPCLHLQGHSSKLRGATGTVDLLL